MLRNASNWLVINIPEMFQNLDREQKSLITMASNDTLNMKNNTCLRVAQPNVPWEVPVGSAARAGRQAARNRRAVALPADRTGSPESDAPAPGSAATASSTLRSRGDLGGPCE